MLRRQCLASAALLALGVGLTPAWARGGGSGHGGSHAHGSSHAAHGDHASHPGGKHSATPSNVPRDEHGRIARSSRARSDFKQDHPCPSTGKHSGACPGYVIDHVRPLKRGGRDAPDNMQWQSTAAAKAKDRTE
jgi:hypothetical protein